MNKKERTVVPAEKINVPDEYYEKSGISAHIKEVLSLLVENRPKDPLSFLSQYFAALVEEVNPIVKAQRLLCLTHHSRPAFQDNVVSAYKLLRDKGLNGKIHNELLKSLSAGLPPIIVEKLMEKLACREVEAVPHLLFYSNVLACLVCHDYKKHSELLYKELGTVCDRGVCESLLQLLTQHTNKYDLSSSAVQRAIVSVSGYGQSYLSCEDFVHSALELYVDFIPETI